MRNDPVDPAVRARAVAAAQGREPFDLLMVGGTVVDVGCGELRAADVGIVGPLIASVHERGSRTDALDVIDCTGRFVAPGFIDMHVHFESSMLTPGGYAEAVCPRGTTTVFVDPARARERRGCRRCPLRGRGEPRSAGAVRRAGAVVRAAAARASSSRAPTSTDPTSPRCCRGTRSAVSPR